MHNDKSIKKERAIQSNGVTHVCGINRLLTTLDICGTEQKKKKAVSGTHYTGNTCWRENFNSLILVFNDICGQYDAHKILPPLSLKNRRGRKSILRDVNI